MFAGLFEQRIIYSAHPFLVMDAENVTGAFRCLAEAEEFVSGRRQMDTIILGHAGQEWIILKDRLINPLLHSTLNY